MQQITKETIPQYKLDLLAILKFDQGTKHSSFYPASTLYPFLSF